MKIYIDAMGGDNAPGEIIKGTIQAIKEYDIEVTLVGNPKIISEELIKRGFDDKRITILEANSVIDFNEEPVRAIRHKKDSSIVVALNDMKGDEDAVLISAGSTGALLAGATLILGRIPGVARPGLGISFPQKTKTVFLIDVGASSDYIPSYLYTYAILAKTYLEAVEKKDNPSIGLINVGIEEEKGSKSVKDAYQLLKNSNLNFKGNVEPKDIFVTNVDALVTDGFTGNIIIKTVEGLSNFVFNGLKETLMQSIRGKLGALLIKDDLKSFKNTYDPDEIGGSPFLGVKGGVIKAHGSSNAHAFKNAIHQGILFAQNHVVERMQSAISEEKNKENE